MRGVASAIDRITANAKPDVHDTPGRLRAQAAVGQIGDQERHGVGERAPGDPVVDRILHEHVRRSDDQGHGDHPKGDGTRAVLLNAGHGESSRKTAPYST